MENASIILELLTRIQTLEKQVGELQTIVKNQCNNVNNNDMRFSGEIDLSKKEIPYCYNSDMKKRDTTKYLFNGAVYSKNRLVLAVVKDYVSKHNPSFEELHEMFHPSLQGSIGVVERADAAQKRLDYKIRFFTEENEILNLIDGDVYVCNQWGILNIPRFLSRARDLDYIIQEIR